MFRRHAPALRRDGMFTGLKLLIVEEEYLIALDMERIVADAHAASAVFTRSVGECAAMQDRWSDFDLAIVKLREGDEDGRTLCRGLIEAGVAVVVTTSDSNAPDFPGVPVIAKPFAEDGLLDACRSALSSRPGSAGG